MAMMWIQEGISQLLGYKGKSTSSLQLSAQHKYINRSNMTFTRLQERVNLAATPKTCL